MDSYQPIYDAVRSRISGGDVGSAVERAMRDANLSHYAEMAMRAAQDAASEASRPSVLMRPALSLDGDQWCALYGENVQDGVAGFGASPYLAMYAFDRAWETKTPPAEMSVSSPSVASACTPATDEQPIPTGET